MKQPSYLSIHWLRRFCQQYWVSLLLGILTTSAVLGLWQQLLVQEQLHIQQLVQQEANAIEIELSRAVSDRILALERMADRWQLSRGTARVLWEADASNYVNQYYGFQAIEWIDPSFHVRWVVPVQGNEVVQNFDVRQEPRRHITLRVARELHQTLLTRTISLAQGGKGFLVCVPLVVHTQDNLPTAERFDGFIVGVFRFETLFDSTLKVSPRYKVQIFDRNGLIYRQSGALPSTLSRTVLIQAYGADWQVQVSPTPVLITEGRSLLPSVVLWVGLAGAWTLAFMVYLGQRAVRQTQRTQNINRQLQAEIRHREQAEISLRDSEERLQLALEASAEGWWDWNIETGVVERSPQYLQLLGYKMGEFPDVVDSWNNSIHPDDLSCMMERLTAHMQDNSVPYTCEYRLRTKLGGWQWILDYGKVVACDTENNPLRMIGTVKDIGDRKRAEIALRDSEAKYRQLSTHINAGFVVHAPDTHILQCNVTACDLLGLSMDEILGKEAIDPVWHLIREDGTAIPVAEYPVNRVLSTQAPLNNYVIGVNRANGSQAWALVTAFPEFDSNQQLTQVVVTFIDISELKQAEAALMRSEERLSLVLKGSNEGWWDWDLLKNKIYYSPRWWGMLGYEPEELENTPDLWQQLMYPGDCDQTTQFFQQQLTSGIESYEVEFRLQHKQGHYVPIVSRGYISRDNSGTPIRVSGTNTDLSDRKQAELALQESEEQFRTFMQNLPLLAWIADAQGTLLYANPTLFEAVGGIAAEAVGQPITALFPAEIAQEYLRNNQTVIETGTIIETIEVAPHTDGMSREYLVRKFPIHHQGQTTWVGGIALDITHQRQAERAMRQSEERFRQIAETIQDVFFINAPDLSQVDYISPAFETIWGLSCESLYQYPESWLSTIHPDDQVRVKTALQRQLAGEPFQEEYRIVRSDGTVRWIFSRAFPKFSESGELAHSIGLASDITERKQADLALQENEEQFRVLVTYAPVGIFQTDEQGKCVYVNPRWLEMTGLSLEAALEDGWMQSLHPDDRKAIFQEWIQATKEGRPFNLEYRFQKPDGTVTWVSGQAIAVRDETEAVVRYFGTVMDITARKQAEATKQALIESIPDFLVRMRRDGIYLEVLNHGAVQLVLPVGGKILGTSITEMIPPAIAQERLELAQQALASGIIQTQEYQFELNGAVFYEEARIAPLGADEVLVVVRDITERYRSEQALRDSEEKFRQLAENIHQVFFILSVEGKMLYISPAYEQVWQRSCESLYLDPYSWLESVYSEDRSRIVKSLRHQISLKQPFNETYRIIRQDGEIRWIAAQSFPLKDEAGNVIRFTGIAEDITQRKQAEEALRQAMKAAEAANLAKSIFLANMSHELRTPLNVILGFAQVMLHDSSLTPNQLEDLQTIQRSGDHLLGLINDVLDLSKIEAGYCNLEETGFDLIFLLHGLCTMMTERAKAKQLELTFDIAPEAPQFVMADEQKLRQILLNLLSNAIKFTKQGSVTLQVNVVEGKTVPPISTPSPHPLSIPTTLEFTVIDTGIGIAPQELDTIFDAFVQAEAGKKSVSGTGLGLTISRKLLEIMKGTIAVHSVPQVGSTFTFAVPVYRTCDVTVQPEQSMGIVIGLVPGQPHRRILVVDDQQENRRLMVRILAQLGLEIREAADGQEAVQIWQEWQPDLTWMDIRMPGLDGYEATRQIRAMEQEKASIIIALTAQASQSDRNLALAAGCNDYISKPFREETVFFKMAEHLGLEYLYGETISMAEAQRSSSLPFSAQPLLPELTQLTLPDLSALPEAWLHELEDAALCCDDQAVLELLEQLSPEFAQLAAHLTRLANQYQFEQILKLFRPGFSI